MKVKIIIPYFGKLPLLFKYYSKGIKNNPNFDFLIITDQIINLSESNLFIWRQNYNDIKKLIFDKVNVDLMSPYKLCDLKPLYGVIFEEFLTGYDYWAHSDIDMIIGDLNIIYPVIQLNKYDKILDKGHLSFYRNTNEINNLYKHKSIKPEFLQYILNSPLIWVFDETRNGHILGINDIITSNGYRLYEKRNDFVDVSPFYLDLTDHNSKISNFPGIFLLSEGKLFFIQKNIEGDLQKKEIIYAHFLKREVNYIEKNSEIIIYPKHWNNIEDLDDCYLKLDPKNLRLNKPYVHYLRIRKIRKYLSLIISSFTNHIALQLLLKTILRNAKN